VFYDRFFTLKVNLPGFESKILDRLRVSNIPKRMKLHKILDNLKSYHKECFQKLKRMDTYPYIVKCYRRIV